MKGLRNVKYIAPSLFWFKIEYGIIFAISSVITATQEILNISFWE